MVYRRYLFTGRWIRLGTSYNPQNSRFHKTRDFPKREFWNYHTTRNSRVLLKLEIWKTRDWKPSYNTKLEIFYFHISATLKKNLFVVFLFVVHKTRVSLHKKNLRSSKIKNSRFVKSWVFFLEFLGYMMKTLEILEISSFGISWVFGVIWWTLWTWSKWPFTWTSPKSCPNDLFP